MLSRSILDIINSIPIPIAVASSDGEVIAANDIAQQLWPKPGNAKSLLGLNLEALTNSSDSEQEITVSRFVTDGGSEVKILSRTISQAAASDSAHYQGRLEAILETTVDAIITIDERGRIESFNRAATKIFGYELDEVLNKNVSMLMPEPYKSEHDDYISNYVETGVKKIIGIGRQVTGKRKDNTLFPMDLAVSEVRINGQRKFTGIVRDISERLQLEKEILRVSDEERSRIGQDLHDELGQMLTGIGLLTRNIERTLRAKGADEADEIAEITLLLSKADDVARSLSHGLMPVVLDEKGLSSALLRLAQKVSKLSGMQCSFEETGYSSVSNEVAHHLYRIAQEAVNNALKHGKATEVKVHLHATKDLLRLKIADNGLGFNVDWRSNGGMGVRIMQHRASIIGGALDITSNNDNGTDVICTIRS